MFNVANEMATITTNRFGSLVQKRRVFLETRRYIQDVVGVLCESLKRSHKHDPLSCPVVLDIGHIYLKPPLEYIAAGLRSAVIGHV